MNAVSGLAFGAFSARMASSAAARIAYGNAPAQYDDYDDSVVPLQKYNNLAIMYNDLVARVEAECDAIKIAIRQARELMVYINGLRIAAGYKPLEPDEITAQVHSNKLLSRLEALVDEKTEASDYGRFSQQAQFWREMNMMAFTPFTQNYRPKDYFDSIKAVADTNSPEHELIHARQQNKILKNKLAAYEAKFGKI